MVTIGRSLRELSGGVPEGRVIGDADVVDIAYDSRRVMPGTLFGCVPGAKVDGHAFARAAIASGASALLVERELDLDIPQLIVPSVRAAMGPIAAELFDRPSTKLELIGVTGTNGKTTTTFMLESVTAARGGVAGTIGTIRTRIGPTIEPATLTTPEAPDTQRLLARMLEAGVTTCAMEVSSRALDIGRVDGCEFAVAAFTNLTQDHLDEHGTMDAYFEAKALLFDRDRTPRAVINLDDPWGRMLRDRIGNRLEVVTFALEADADVRAERIEVAAASSTVRAAVGEQHLEMVVPISGRYNVGNALTVLAIAHSLGWDLEAVVEGIASVPVVPGRMERIEAGQPFSVLVDYAHTPDSVDNVLRAARELVAPGARLWVVLGCGGDRDRKKRPLMGIAGASLSDILIVTSDNPRTEDPAAIVAEIAAGARTTGRDFEQIVNRRDAIARAIDGAEAGDVVVIAGKGHETGQIFADRTIPFDDRLVARELLEARS